MEMKKQRIQSVKMSPDSISMGQSQQDEQKLKGISLMVKELKINGNSEIYQSISRMQVRKHGKFLLEYLSRQKVYDRTLFFETLASLDSLLSIFKVNLFMQLNFEKKFYRNIQKEFELLCLQYNFETGDRQQKQQDFQLYSILFLLVMLIYFSGKRQCQQMKSLPLQIINKTFINSLISLQINITQKNQRIIGLIMAFMVKNINLKIYGEKMFRFILNHFDKIQIPRTMYHFVYCMRQIHLEREIDVKIVRKFSLFDKLWKFWGQTFASRESIYLVDYINLILNKYPSIVNTIKTMQLLRKILFDFERIEEFSVVHQGLILDIMVRVEPKMENRLRQQMIQKGFRTCCRLDISLKLISCLISKWGISGIMEEMFEFVCKFSQICLKRSIKSILLGIQILCKIVQKCYENRLWGILCELREKIYHRIEELKEFNVCRVYIARIEEYFSRMISIQYQTLC